MPDGRRTSKGLLAAGDDDGTDVLVLIVLGESIVQLREEGAAESIQGFGPVESDYISRTSVLVQELHQLIYGRYILNPTPGLGVSVRMCSYVEEAEEYGRVVRARKEVKGTAVLEATSLEHCLANIFN